MKPPATYRVLVVDDHPFFRDGIMQWIERQESFTCCGYADTPDSTRQAVARLKPDVLLLDLQLRESDGFGLIKELAAAWPGLRVIVVSQKDELLFGQRALRAGARGYVMKEEAAETMLTALETVLRGELYASARLARQMVSKMIRGQTVSEDGASSLSDREMQVFQLLGMGLNNKAIAAELQVSPKTIETYREGIKRKLGFSNGNHLLQQAALWVHRAKPPTD